MTNTSALYWLTRLDNIKGFFTAFLILGILGIVVLLFIRFINYSEGDTYRRRPGIMAICITSIFIGALGITLIPSVKEAVFIVAGGKTLDYVSSDTALKKIPGQLTGITSAWLEGKLKEIEGDLKTEETKK